MSRQWARVRQLRSTQNNYVKHLAKLENTKYRREKGTCLIYGRTAVEEARAYQKPLNMLIGPAVDPATVAHNRIYQLEHSDLLAHVAGVNTAPEDEIAAEFEIPQQNLSLLREPPQALLVIDGLGDPGNVGTLLRSAWAFGWDGVILVKGSSDPFSQKAIRSSAGAAFGLPYCWATWKDLTRLIETGSAAPEAYGGAWRLSSKVVDALAAHVKGVPAVMIPRVWDLPQHAIPLRGAEAARTKLYQKLWEVGTEGQFLGKPGSAAAMHGGVELSSPLTIPKPSFLPPMPMRLLNNFFVQKESNAGNEANDNEPRKATAPQVPSQGEPSAAAQPCSAAAVSTPFYGIARGWIPSTPPAPKHDRRTRLLIVGHETRGPSQEARKLALPVTIPMLQGVHSLNAGVAGSVLLQQLSPATAEGRPRVNE